MGAAYHGTKVDEDLKFMAISLSPIDIFSARIGEVAATQSEELTMARQTIELTLHDVVGYRWTKGRWQKQSTPETWIVRDALSKLRTKYSIGSSLIFDHYVFHYPHREPNRITSVDMTAVDKLMSGNLSAKKARWSCLADPSCQRRVQKVLARIPQDATIEDARWDGLVVKAVGALKQPEVRTAIATKLLMVKRPFAVPMLDSRLQEVFTETSVESLLPQLRRLLLDNRDAIEKLRIAVAVEFGLQVSPLRILDQLLWFDWNLSLVPDSKGRVHVLGLPEWVYDTQNDARGVYRETGA